MMRTTCKALYVYLFAALVAMNTACTNEELTPQSPEGEGKLTTICVGMPVQPTTRVAFDDGKVDDTTPNDELTWETDDELVVSRGNDKQIFTTTDSGITASFTGTEPSGTGNFTISYPANFTSMSEQVQDAANSTAHLKNYIVLEKRDVTNLSAPISLEMKSSIMKFHLTALPSDMGTLKKLIWIVETQEGPRSHTLDLQKANLTNPGTLTAFLGFMPQKMSVKAGGNFTVILQGSAKAYQVQKTIASGKNYAAAMRYTAAMSGWAKASSQMKFTVKTTSQNESFELEFGEDSSLPAALTVDWGDGITEVIDAQAKKVNHRYYDAVNHQITITSGELDPTKKQMRQLKFLGESAKKLIRMDSPMLNVMGDMVKVFEGCSSLNDLPARLFSNNIDATNFSSCFSGCTALTSLPAGLFSNNIAATDFSNCFSGCTALASLPAGLFSENREANNFENCFNLCSKLELNATIFSSPEDLNRFVEMDKVVFRNCFSNTGKDSNPKGTAPQLWNYKQKEGAAWSIESCFSGCNVTNMNDIPKGWK